MSKKVNKNKPALIILIVLCMTLVLTILLIVFGSIADNTGTTCTGLLGGNSSCVDAYLTAAMIYSPALILIGAAIYIVKKIYDRMELKKKPQSKTKR